MFIKVNPSLSYPAIWDFWYSHQAISLYLLEIKFAQFTCKTRQDKEQDCSPREMLHWSAPQHRVQAISLNVQRSLKSKYLILSFMVTRGNSMQAVERTLWTFSGPWSKPRISTNAERWEDRDEGEPCWHFSPYPQKFWTQNTPRVLSWPPDSASFEDTGPKEQALGASVKVGVTGE